MPQDTHHPQYDLNYPLWKRCRDAVGGEDAIKAAGEMYLPSLEGQVTQATVGSGVVSSDYEKYKGRAVFYGATGRTVEGLRGAVMRKPPTIQVPKQVEGLLESVVSDGDSFLNLASRVVGHQLSPGRVGLLVDAASEPGSAVRPFVSVYCAESIINWKSELVDGRRQLTFVMLVEDNAGEGGDEYEHPSTTQYREYRLHRASTDENGSAVSAWVEVVVWEKQEDEGNEDAIDPWVEVERFNLTRQGGKPWEEIPFVFINSNNTTPEVTRPPILDLVNVNLAHYRNSADLEHGLHFTALPVAWVAGFDTSGDLRIGSQVAWVTENSDAKAGYLEFSGSGLGSIVSAMDNKERLMAVLGARLLETKQRQVESAESFTARQGGDTVTLRNVVQAASEGLTQVLRWLVAWFGQDPEDTVRVQLNGDVVANTLTPQMLASLMQKLQEGTISFEVYYYNMERGEMYPPDWSMQDELDALAGVNQPPPARPTQLEDLAEDEGGETTQA